MRVCVCVCVCMSVSMLVCVCFYVYVYVHVHVHVYACKYPCVHACVCACIECVPMSECVCMSICVCECVSVCVSGGAHHGLVCVLLELHQADAGHVLQVHVSGGALRGVPVEVGRGGRGRDPQGVVAVHLVGHHIVGLEQRLNSQRSHGDGDRAGQGRGEKTTDGLEVSK